MKRNRNQTNNKEKTINYREDSIADQLFQNQNNLPTKILQELSISLAHCSNETLQEVTTLLTQILEYPSTQTAEKHSQANRLGLTDLMQEKPKVQSQQTIKKHQYCQDCGLLIQKDTIPICSSPNQFPNAGIGAFLLFSTVKSLSILLLILGLTYSGYALYSNINEPHQSLSTDNFTIKLSYAPIILNVGSDDSLVKVITIQSWLLIGVVVIWMICLFFINFNQIKNKRMVDNNTITAADFSIMIQNIPYQITRQQVQNQMNIYYQQLQDKGFIKEINGSHGHINPFQIKKYCKAVPYHMLEDEQLRQEIQQLQKQIQNVRNIFVEWIQYVQLHHQLPSTRQLRNAKYVEFKKLQKLKEEKQNISKFPSKKKKGKREIDQTTVFITFQRSQSANFIGEINPQGLSQKISYYLSCCSSSYYFDMKANGKSLGLKVSRAPEPEDVNWQNIGVDFCSILLRKCGTYLVTLILLGASFGIVYGLIRVQQSSNNSILSYAITLSITIINVLIGLAIEGLTFYERDFTKTNRQISYALKSIIAQLMNSILVPVISNIYIRKNIYLSKGLVQQIFILAITNSLVPPILQFVNPAHLVNRFMVWFKSRPSYKLKISQQTLNKTHEYLQFQLGYPYIYYMNSFYFTCFYVTMQPYVVIPSLIGFLLMYWADKRRLLAYSQRPIPSSELLNDAMGQLVLLSPFMLTLGNLTWFVFVSDVEMSKFNFLTQLISLGVCVAFYLIPMDSILDACCGIPDDERLIYDNCRGSLASQYDRLNPATKQEGLRIFLQFLSAHKKGAETDGKPNIFATMFKKLQKVNENNNMSSQNLGGIKNSQLNKTEENLLGKLVNFEDYSEEENTKEVFQKASPSPSKNRYKAPVKQNKEPYNIFKDNRGYQSNKSKPKSGEGNPYHSLQFK